MKPPKVQWQSPYTLRDFTAAVFRQSRLATATFAFVAAAVIAAVAMAPKVYDADLKILVKRDRADSLVSGTPESDRSNTGEVSEQELLSEVELLQARDLLEQVVTAPGMSDGGANGARMASDELAEAVSELRGHLNVAAVRKTWMIDATYTSSDPRRAKTVLDTLAQLYLAKHLAVRRPAGAHKFFVDQSEESAAELRTAQQRLQEFGDRKQIVSAAAQQDSVLLKLAEFEGLQRQTEVSLAEMTRRIAALEREKSVTPARHTSQVHTSDPAVVQEMQSRILGLESKRTELLQKYTPTYRLVTDLDQQLAQTRAALEDARRGQVVDQTVGENPTMQWLDNEIARARPERAALETRARTLRETVASYRAQAQSLTAENTEQKDLQRVVKAAEDKYLLYQRKQEEARISDALDRTRIANVVIAEAPTVPSEARRTRSLVWLPVGLLGALVLAIGVALAVDATSTAIRTPDELQDTLEVPVLAWVPAGPPS